jgi:hypothetical protein
MTRIKLARTTRNAMTAKMMEKVRPGLESRFAMTLTGSTAMMVFVHWQRVRQRRERCAPRERCAEKDVTTVRRAQSWWKGRMTVRGNFGKENLTRTTTCVVDSHDDQMRQKGWQASSTQEHIVGCPMAVVIVVVEGSFRPWCLSLTLSSRRTHLDSRFERPATALRAIQRNWS